MMEGEGADEMGFSSSIVGSSDGKSDGGATVAIPMWDTRVT